MVSKNNKKLIAEKNRRNEKQRFAIRKLNVGVASVLLGITFSIYGGGQAVAHADTGNARGQVAARDAGDNSLATKSEVALSSANQSSTSATSANGAVQSQSSANSQPAATANTPVSDSAVASNAAVEATKNQSTAENQPSPSQKVQTPAQPVAQENGSSDASLNTTRQVLHTIANRNLMLVAKSFAAVPASDSVETSTLNLFTNQETNANALAESKVATTALAAETEDPNAVTVSTAQDFINAIQKGTANTINVASDLNLGNIKSSTNYTLNISNKRDLVIQSADGDKKTIDLNGYSFRMSSDNSVTFKDLTMYGRNWFGAIENASSYTFDNVDYTGSELVYTTRSATVTFKNNVTAHAVDKYTSPLDGEEYKTQPGQQVLQFTTGTNQIIFDEGSNVTLETDNGNVIQNQGDATITVKNGANVTLNPHASTVSFENAGTVSKVARGIYSAGGAINIEQGGNLVINLSQNSGDPYLPGAIYLNSGAVINDNGNIKINVNGAPYNGAKYTPVYLNGDSTIKVGNGASFEIAAENLGDFNSSLFTVNGKGTVTLEPHSTFKITGDGTGAVTAVGLGSGSTFTSDQPDAFTIDLSANTSDGKALIKNGTIKFSRVKTVTTDGTTSEPLGKIDVTYDRNGNATSYTITAQDENTVKQVADGLTNKSLINLVQAGEDVTLSNLHLSKNNVLTGTVASSGSDNPIYVTVTVGGVSTNVPVAGNYTVYTNTNGTVTSDNVDYAAQTGSTGGNFSIDLSKLASSLTDDTQVTVTATKDFVEGSQTESVAALRALNTATLQELVDAAPAEKAKPSYYNATAEAQKAYTDAISTGKTILANPNNYDQVDVDDAVTAIQNAQKALTGEPTNKTELQDAIDQASTVESNDNYTNADSNLQKAYTDAISAGQTVLSNDNATQTEVDNALTTINNAKDALNGDAKKTASKEALQKAVNEAPTVKSDDAAYYNGSAEAKAAYDNAITAGQTVLANPDATATQITDALTAINTAKGNLKGEATDKSALQTAVDNSATVKESNNYTNADETQKTAYNNAVTAAQTVLDKTNATQAEVNQALQDLETANNNLNGDAKTEAANKAALEAAVKDAPNVRNTPAYYNGSKETQTAYNNAITAGQKVLGNPDATATQITDALNAINTAKGNLKGEATDKSALQKAVDNSTTVKESINYTNADKTQKTAYDNAVTAAQTVLDKTNATQAEVNQALQDLETANNNLNGDAKTEAANKAALEAAVKDAPNVRNTPAYYNGSEEAQTAYNNAINAGQAVLDQANPAASEVKNALDAINAAKDNLKGVATNTEALETALTSANKAKETGNYTNADQAKQEALNNAITAGQEILKNTNATQAQVNSAAKAITEAISGLNGNANLEDAKDAATEAIQKALDSKTTQITDATNIDQATKEQLIADAKKAAENANTAINQATDPNAVNTAKAEGITNINKVTVPSLDGAKEAANKAIDQALDTKTKEINNAENIDQTTKDQLIKEATDAANTAKDAIKKSTTNDEATKAGQAGVDAINNVKVPSVTDSQNAAKEAIDNALNAKTKEINDANNIDQTTKDQLIKEATDAANNAKEAIDKATAADAIKTARDEGTTNINNVTVPSLEDAKKAANKAVDDALTAQTEVINKADNLSDTEKKDLIDQATAEANKAKENIETATTNNEAAQAGQAGVDAIKKIVPTSLDTVKSDANKAIEAALTKKLEEINSANALTTDEKTALTQEANTAADKAKEEITNATTNDVVIKAQTNGVTAIDDIKVPTESAVKEAAKQAVADAATAKNKAIDASNLTDEEKADLKQKVTEAQNAADQAIDNATTNAAVTEAQNKGVNTINGIKVPTTSATKEQAITDLNTTVDDAKKAIDQDNNLTDEQKQAAKDQIDSDAKTAQDAINNAKTNDDVKKAADNGTLAIDKDVANAAIDNAVAGKKAEISNSSLTDEEKAALNNEVDQKAQAAKEAVNAATTPEAVTSAQGSGVKNINDTSVPAESDAKQAAKRAVAEAADAKNNAIDASNLTDEEKAALKQKVTDAQNAADQAIDNATTNAAVTEAQNKGVSAIDGIEIPNKSDAKEKAVTDLNTAVENAKKAIDQDSNLTDEQKQAAKDQIDSDAKTAQDAINNAKTNDDVKKAVDDGTLAIDKDVANAAIDNAAAGKLKEIQDPLTTEEKQAYTDLINSEANNAKQNIANATTVEEVTAAQTNGVNEITNTEIPTTSSAKDKAIAAINDALQKKTDEINSASNLNTQEKADLIKQATDAANTAKDNINNATTNADVDTAQTNGEKAIADITVPNLSDVKKESIDLINKALNAKTDEINNASNLSQDEKQSLINDATNAATEAINNVNQAQTNDDAKAAATTGVQNIENVTIPTLDDVKKNANQAIDDALNAKVNEINNASNLNDTEKQKLVDRANEAAATAKNNVENAATNDGVRDAANVGIDNIKGITFTSLEDAKNAANTAIDNALQVKADEINNASNLSTDEKQDLINQASEAAKNAKDNINNATTNDAVTDAQNKGIADIANVTVPSLDQVKQDAINAIKQVQDAKNKQISAASNLSAEEQKELTDQVDKIANDAIAKINDAATTTNDAVNATRDEAIKQITDLFIPTLDGAQTDAINAIESAKNAKLNDINNAAHLTDQEKQALVDQTNKVADEAMKEIKAAQTNDAVKSAETAGLDNINNITIPTLVQKQQEAIGELNAARDAKNSAIDNAADLTTDEKNALKDKVQAEYSNAVSNITSATTDEAVTTAKENGIAAIKDIQIPTKSPAKEQATSDLKTAVDEAKNAIDQDSNLTDEEKQAAKDQIDSDAKKAQEAIDNAKTDDEVSGAVDNGNLAIDKDVANAAIDNAVAGKKEEISKSPLTDEEKAALNSEVDQKAQDAKEAINNAITPEAVTTAQDNGIKNINDTEVPTESTAKEAAKKAITEAAEAKNNAIDSSNLTDEEKAALKQEVTDAQNAANTAIDNATTNAAVTEAEDNGIKAINGIEIPTKSPAKDQATTDLNDAVNDAKKAIDQDNNLTDAEKQAAKDQIDSDAKKAQEAIDNAKTDDEVKTAVDNGQLAIDKDVANAAIDNAVAGKKAEIAKAPLTTDEANALNDLVDQEAKAAKKAIDSATTIPAVEDAKNTGVAAINDIAVPTTSSTKDQANQTIDDALANKIKEINDATNLSDKQKQDLIDQANEEAAKAKENIKNATSNEAVNKATTDGVDAIANVTVPSLDDAKKDASQVIDDVLKQKEDEINNASHLTEQEKQDLINQAQNAANEAKDKINQATTNDDVATERDTGAEKIANIVVPSLEDAKDKATKAIDDALADKTKEINDQTHLSDQEKNDLIKQITDIADKAKDKINNDSNDAEVAKDEKDGIDAIVDTKVPGLEDRKQNAIKTLDEAKSTKLAQIDEATHLTADEKANLTQQVDAEYNKALDNINKATTNDDADKASADGVEAILNIAVPSLDEKKQDSIDALNEVREAKKEEINNANNLSQDEKDELTKQVDQIADNAINAIDGAKDDQTAKDAENKGIQDILDVKVPSLDEAKTNAKQAVADALESKTNEINAASNLDSATKQELINRANAEADTAIEKIDQATSNDQALAASQAGVDKILGIEVPTLADAKQSAIDAINDALKQKETEINNASQLTSDEKQNLINQVNSIADNAKNAINNATTNQSVEEAKNAGIEKINAINVPTTSATKDEAIKAIDDALTNKVNEINNATNITAEEKANLIDEANNAANTAKDNITKATSDSEVATATTDGIDAIANVTVPSLETAKDQAKNMIDDVLNEKKNEINNAQNLSDKQKQDLINQATDEADQAKKNIDNATTNNDVQTAEDNGAQAIENVTVPSLDNAKKASTKVIDEVLKEKTAEINAATNLSNAEKDALIKDATTAANTAKDNIAKATTNDAVKDAETDGIKAILDIKVPGREDQQKDAIAALDRALADKVSEINNANNLSETTKQDLKQQAQAAYTTAVDNVNNAQTSAEINTARDNGVQAILDITVPTLTDAQDASITAIEQVRDAKKTQIEAAKNLTEAQKEALKNQVDEIADKAIDNIKNATTDATVKDAETAGINEILNVTIPTLEAAKSDAKQAITDALTAKTAEINAAQNLTDAEKQKLIDQAQTEAAAANKKIDAATTNDAVELAAKNGVQAILDIQVPTVEETRDQAKKNVDNALNSKKEEINNSNLSPAAKEALINEAEQAAENARTAIDNATTASAISEAEAAGIAAIENIKVSNAPTESDNSSNHQTNTETPTEGNSTSQDNNNATQAPVQGNNTQADLTGSHGTNLTTGQQTEKAADTNSKEALPQTGNETERGLSIAGLAIASLLGLFGLSGLGKKKRD
ncbi:YSIRK signal domain/LPXTG anchor domain surface protein [Limosilactobacillus reuteri]|uniref:YSIRK signal domain/LPXTG anchor domain surface protein n=1 Tax=Limosilactobacillus reuteri TaxID=1598 RepID=A0AAW9U1N2_LIMRT|nr:YSIRK signal domain/LPXTG anchor domain surface protein [Limosilactobacillus reuteri]MRG74739.1 YSIRK signal domain/LPXTG anchor domain surface protein [Limosilactobacillus reuteri]